MISRAWMRFIPFLGYHHVLMILMAIVIIVFSIVLSGCTASNGLANIYLLSISYLNTTGPVAANSPAQVTGNISSTFIELAGTRNGTHLEVRAGYMGMCISQSIRGLWICSSSATTLVDLLKSQNSDSSNIGHDPLKLIWMANKFRNEIVFDGLIYTGIPLALITLLLLATFPGWHEDEDSEGSEREVQPFPSRPVSYACLACTAITSIFMFVSVFWQHIGSSASTTMIEALSYGAVKGHVGTAAMALGWVGVLLLFIVTIGLLIMILSIRVLQETFADE